MKKKMILMGLLAAGMVFTLTACGGGDSGPSLPVADSGASQAIQDVHQVGVQGLADYLRGNGAVANQPIGMMAEIIGAKEGLKYHYMVGDKEVLLELYQFDTKNLSDTANTVLQSVRDNGYFSVTTSEGKVLVERADAMISDNGAYVIVYNTTGTDEAEVNFREKLKTLLNEYANGENTIEVRDTSSTESSTSSQSDSTSSEA